jgi:hypothetical protein
MLPVQYQLWIDDPAKLVCTPKYFDELAEAGITGVAIMVDTPDRAWDPTWTTGQLATAARLAGDRGMHLGITTWTWPDPVVIQAIERSMLEWVSAFPFHEWESDLEFNWQPRKVAGFHSQRDDKDHTVRTALDLAGDRLVEAKKRVKAQVHRCACLVAVPGPRPGICTCCGKAFFDTAATSLPGHAEGGKNADVTNELDHIWLQCYSTRSRKRKNQAGEYEDWDVPWEHSYGPGRMQTMSLDRLLALPGVETGRPRVGVGLAGWSQDWPGRNPADALIAALTAARIHPIHRYSLLRQVQVRYWSSKFFNGVKRNGYLKNFVQYAPRA